MKVVKSKVKNQHKVYNPDFEPRDKKRSKDRKWRSVKLRELRAEKYSAS